MSILLREELLKEIKLTWNNIEANLKFLKRILIVHLFVDNVCVEKKEIPYDTISTIKVIENE